jgi:methyl-accepting chemotaxis protein
MSIRSMISGSKLQTKIGLAFLAPAIIVTAALGVVFYAVENLHKQQEDVYETKDVIAKVASLGTNLVNIETGQRGYVITGNPTFLEAYNWGISAFATELSDLRQASANHPDQLERLARIDQLFHGWVEDAIQPPIDIRGDIDNEYAFESAVDFISMGIGRSVINNIRSEIADFVTAENLRNDERLELAAEMEAWVRYAVLGAGIALLFGIGFLLFFIRGIVVRRIMRLDDAARQMAGGDETVRVQIDANDEIGKLGASFNEMAQNVQNAFEGLNAEKASVEARVEEAVSQIRHQQAHLQASVETMLSAMNRFADGDLTVSLQPEGEDAISMLYAGFNRAASNLRGMMREVNEAVQAAASAATQISASSEQLASSSEEQNAQSTEVAAAVEQMVRTIVENSRNATHVAEAARRSEAVATEGGSLVRQTAEKVEEIGTLAARTTEAIDRFAASSKRIGAIVDTIEEIADQTNLLALNAAIEAARAGDQGRGFAVVADEVRKLAERTTSATKEVASIVAQLHTETGAAVRAMAEGKSSVSQGIDLATEAGNALERIQKTVNSSADMINQIAAASEEQSTTSEQISRSIEMISTVTSESAQGVAQIARASDGLSRLTDDLRQTVERFRVDQSAPHSRTHKATTRAGDDLRRDPVLEMA